MPSSSCGADSFKAWISNLAQSRNGWFRQTRFLRLVVPGRHLETTIHRHRHHRTVCVCVWRKCVCVYVCVCVCVCLQIQIGRIMLLHRKEAMTTLGYKGCINDGDKCLPLAFPKYGWMQQCVYWQWFHSRSGTDQLDICPLRFTQYGTPTVSKHVEK